MKNLNYMIKICQNSELFLRFMDLFLFSFSQIFAINGMSPGDLLTHRVSGYYTSSQSSVAENKLGKYVESCRLKLSLVLLQVERVKTYFNTTQFHII